ncbi:glycosyltransferase [Microlunatus ginsengisoli]|uniref:Salmochelin biosynthesis C-glycosyltransferase IroB n=1 Tax=Microlunatus ginsengisoli TaxID=363863 RepID=A0ABP7A8Z3_9ACTN
MRIFFAAAPAYGLMLPIVPLIWAARAAGHEVLLATAGEMAEVGAEAGLPVVDVHPDRERWAALMGLIGRPDAVPAGSPPEIVAASRQRPPFAMFCAVMTEPTIAAARAFEPDLIAYTGDHLTGTLTASVLGLPALEIGNRVGWSSRDAGWRARGNPFGGEDVAGPLRARLGIPDDPPRLVARIDPRAPSMGGLAADQPDDVDQVPWWPMQYVPYNGGTVLPAWALEPQPRPMIGVTLGTVVPSVSGTSSLGVVVEALADLDVDVVLAAGKADLSGLGQLPENVRSVGYLPLSAFLPRCAVLVHHGGSGTTAAPLFYGVPQLVLPAFADNPLSAQRVVDRGVGLSHDPATIDPPTVRGLVDRLLHEPVFRGAAEDVRAEIAAMPTPASITQRLFA